MQNAKCKVKNCGRGKGIVKLRMFIPQRKAQSIGR